MSSELLLVLAVQATASAATPPCKETFSWVREQVEKQGVDFRESAACTLVLEGVSFADSPRADVVVQVDYPQALGMPVTMVSAFVLHPSEYSAARVRSLPRPRLPGAFEVISLEAGRGAVYTVQYPGSLNDNDLVGMVESVLTVRAAVRGKLGLAD